MADRYIREKFTRDRTFARKFAREYFEKYPKDRYETSIETWREAGDFIIALPARAWSAALADRDAVPH